MKERTKDVQIGDRTFQVGSFSPREGRWVSMQFLGRLLYSLENTREVQEKELGASLATHLSYMGEDSFTRIQDKCFALTSEYNAQKVAMPVLMRDGPHKGEWAGDPLDLVDSLALTVSVLVFNLFDFFVPGARDKLLVVFPDFTPKDSTSTSSAR
jgi:tail assembly chaperone